MGEPVLLLKDNETILKERLRRWNRRRGPRVGDFLKLDDGTYTRFTYDWGNHIQTGGHVDGSYYLGNSGISYSGGLDPGIRHSDIVRIKEKKDGRIWFFNRDVSRAGNGVSFRVSCRVFAPKDGADLSGVWTRR